MIKASYEPLQPASGQSFLIRKFGVTAFEAPYHFHPEFELTCIISGNGKRYVGSHMDNFTAGDLVLIGSGLPHCWKLDAGHDDKAEASAIVIQFAPEFLGHEFFDKAELKNIKKLFARSASGARFSKITQTVVNAGLMKLADETNKFKQLILLLEMLQRLAVSSEYDLLDHQREAIQQSAAEQERINPVLAYIVENFRQQISLDKAASIARMTTNAFCKYFKRVTRKTFMEMVIEYRLNYATQQLVQTDRPISDISFDSGFGDVSHFYKMFRSKMRLSPLKYRQQFMRSLNESKAPALV